ncbi:MAG: glutamine synthetase, partial [Gaiellaceae bacterium]|nr:glutamine synthetase [Gaiellaceae bacterium]
MAQVETRNRATSSEDSRKRVLGRIEKEKIEFVLLWFTDIEGHLKSFAVTPSEIGAALDDGMGFDGSSITGFNAIEESDMVAIPDPETFQLMPWREGETRVARMICDIVTPDGNPYEGDPRYVLRRALERMTSLGFDTFNVGPELEYFLFRDDKGTETLDEGGYFAMTTMDAASELRQETVRALESMGIPIEYVHHEVGPSQHEIDMRFSDALSMADHTVTYRLIVKEIAKKAGFHATFMPKPIFGENGSGMHTHQSLFKDGRNAFFDGDDAWNLSAAGKAFIAGQLRH